MVGHRGDCFDTTAFWRKLKQRLKEVNETVTNCHALKMIAKDGKSRLTDVVFKMWFTQVGSERLDEIADPQKAIDR